VAAAIGRATYAARSCEEGPQSGRVEVTFSGSGTVQSVTLLKSFDSVAVNGCVLRAFGRAHMTSYSGEPMVVRKSLSW